eukprot:TRINITY_DN1207_c0_g1_i1.p1 TRINITY_DN1207_c0_g1~~TRINITY_DN1207_c0_g1_i1.p1  ORF type:complete len:431 (-),score=37.44 TRINITY_DN1207_c0_g1_i1:180-1472(-)
MDPSLGPMNGAEEYDPTAPAVSADYVSLDGHMGAPSQGDTTHASDAAHELQQSAADMTPRHDGLSGDGPMGEGGARNGRPSVVCYRCGGRGHMAVDCRPNPHSSPDVQHECYKCKGKGHFARECPTLKYEKCFLCGRFGHHGMDCRERNLGARGGPPRDNYMDRGATGNYGSRYGPGPNVGRDYGPSYSNPYQEDRFRGPEPRGYREPFGQSAYNTDHRRDAPRQGMGAMPNQGPSYYSDNGSYPSYSGPDNSYGGPQDSYRPSYEGGYDDYPGPAASSGGFPPRQYNSFENRGGLRDYDRDRDRERERDRERDRFDARPGGMGSDMYGSRGPVCYKCQQPGHIAKDCMNAAAPGPRPVAERCFRCGDPNHISRFCTANGVSSDGRDSCFKCGGTGHKSRDCSGPDNRVCYICRKPGHVSTNCTERGYPN